MYHLISNQIKTNVPWTKKTRQQQKIPQTNVVHGFTHGSTTQMTLLVAMPNPSTNLSVSVCD